MVVSLRRMSAGDGYKYLLKTVVAGDGDRSLATSLTRYYAETGTPPGRWMGSGVRDLGLEERAEVTQQQLELLIGHGRHPRTGEPLGRSYAIYAKGIKKKAVAGFDYTFSIPKSASVIWAVADAGTQAIIADVHHAAVRDVLDFMEREIAATRTGAGGTKGAVAQVETTGLIAAAYDHWDSRAGDPHLHTHVVVSNKVLTAEDRKWRSLDSRPLHAWTVALSELHQAVFADHLSRALGVDWEPRSRGRDRNPDWAVASVPQTLVKKFSSRSVDIDVAADHLIEQYTATHGHRPGRATLSKIRNRASLATRPAKQPHSLAELTTTWRESAGEHLGADATNWVRGVATNPPRRMLRADDVPLDVVGLVAGSVLGVVGEKRATWRRANLYAEAARQTMGWRFSTTLDREVLTGMVVDAAERDSLRLTPPDLATVPARFIRADGTSMFRPRHATVYSSEQLLAAEDHLLMRAESRTAPTVSIDVVDQITERPVKGQQLSAEQAHAIATICTDARQLDVLVGPAGAGKTTAMRALLNAWSHQHGPDSVVGLAPSAAAAAVLAEDLDIACENTAKWIYEHDHARVAFSAGQLVIVDEATLAGTLTLDRLTGHAEEVGAKVLLVGDWAQLQSVDAGGAFAMLASARDDAPQLTDIHRFTHDWEKRTSLDLRHRRPEAIDAYLAHGRIQSGTGEDMIGQGYTAWHDAITAGHSSVLIADSQRVVDDLNARAQNDAKLTGPGVELASGLHAHVGDVVITRRNDRRLRTLKSGWVRNGDRWNVTDVRRDGSLAVRRQGRRWGGGIVLPAVYVAEHLDLGYAVTAYRAQGITVDSAHVVVADSTTHENFYVAMTRGRETNTAYVALDSLNDEGHRYPMPDHDDSQREATRKVLLRVLATTGAESSAHQTIEAEQEAWGSIAQLADEYETIATAAQRDRWATLLHQTPLTRGQVDQILDADAFGPLAAELRRAEANGHNVERLIPAAVGRHSLEDVEDIAAVLRHRIRLAASESQPTRGRRASHLIAGIIPQVLGLMAPDMRTAIDERKTLIERRASSLAETAIRQREPWTKHLGDPPTTDRTHWNRAVITIAAYRDRYGIMSTSPLGGHAITDDQHVDRARADAALRRLRDRESERTGLRRTAGLSDKRCKWLDTPTRWGWQG